MTKKALRVLFLAALAFFIGRVSYATDGNTGECNIYCRNVVLVQNCLPNFSVYLEFSQPCCTGCEGGGTTFCVDAIDQDECALFMKAGIMAQIVSASSQCPCGNGKISTDAQYSSNGLGWDPTDWRTCGGVMPVTAVNSVE
jgi:hypothetical protein